MLPDAELDERIVRDMIANARPRRRKNETPAQFAMRVQRERQTRANRQRKADGADVIERYTSGEWAMLEDALANRAGGPPHRLTLQTGRAFLTWLERQAWLLEAHIDLRTLAYYTICRRVDKLKEAAGISVLDDALGDKPTFGKLAQVILRLRQTKTGAA